MITDQVRSTAHNLASTPYELKKVFSCGKLHVLWYKFHNYKVRDNGALWGYTSIAQKQSKSSEAYAHCGMTKA